MEFKLLHEQKWLSERQKKLDAMTDEEREEYLKNEPIEYYNTYLKYFLVETQIEQEDWYYTHSRNPEFACKFLPRNDELTDGYDIDFYIHQQDIINPPNTKNLSALLYGIKTQYKNPKNTVEPIIDESGKLKKPANIISHFLKIVKSEGIHECLDKELLAGLEEVTYLQDLIIDAEYNYMEWKTSQGASNDLKEDPDER